MAEDHQLAAIMFTDIAGYTAIMQEDEQKAINIIKKYNHVISKLVSTYHGKILNDYGDGNLCVFSSANDAALCALAIQKQLHFDPEVPLRIGLHIGEYFMEGEKALGDGVNVASRIQSQGQANTILFSEEIQHIIKNNKNFQWISIGKFNFKNVTKPLELFAMTNEGLDVPNQKITGKFSEKVKSGLQITLLLVIGVLLLLLIPFIYRYVKTNEMLNSEEKSIAVLAFADMSSDHSQEYLGEGISEAIINTLTQIKGLKVIGRTSSFSFKGKNMDLKMIGRRLKVNTLLEGSVQRSGDSLRIFAQLIDASDGSHVWSKKYDKSMDGIFKVQDEISQDISSRIQINLSSEDKQVLESKGSVDPDAYNDYLKGQFYWNKLTRSDLATSLHYFELSAEKDPAYAPAYAGISKVWIGRMQMGFSTYDGGIVKAKKAVKKAFELDSSLAEVHWAYGEIAWADWNWNDLLPEFKRSITINPNNPTNCIYYSHYLYVFGYTDEGLIYMKKANDLDPFNPLIKAVSGMNTMYSKKYDQIITSLEENLRTAPDDPVTLTTLRSAYHMKGRYSDAYKIWIRSFETNGDPEAREALKAGYEEGGYRMALQKVAELFIERSKTRNIRSWLVGTIYTRAGMKNEALYWLEKAYQEHDLDMPYIKVDPIFDYMRDEPRFKDLLARMNL